VKLVLCIVLLSVLSVSMCVDFVVASEAGAEGAHHAATFGWAEIFQIINFALLVIFLLFVYRKYAGDGFEKRSQQVKMAIEEAEQARLKAEKKYDQYKARLASLDEEIEDILAKSREEGQKDNDRILQEAELQAEKIHRQVEMTAKQEVANAKQILREETILLAAEHAIGLLRDSVTQDDHDRLVELYLKRLGELN
jgi:F-type H+-transporting ATPase subunit b